MFAPIGLSIHEAGPFGFAARLLRKGGGTGPRARILSATADNRQPQAHPLARARLLQTLSERAEHELRVLGCEPHSKVADCNEPAALAGAGTHDDLSALFAEPDGVVQKIREHLFESRGIGFDQYLARRGGLQAAATATTTLDRGSIQAALRRVAGEIGLKKTSLPTAFATAMQPT